MNCPYLIEGDDWISTDKWPVVLTRDLVAKLPFGYGFNFEFYSGDKLLASLTHDQLTIKGGYACDGYSPVVRMFGRFVRLTPTPSCGMFPAILHDFLRAFIGVDLCPWNRINTDDWFFDALVAGRCSDRAGIYHQAVAGNIGTAWIKLTREIDPHLHITRTPYRNATV